uniref:NADH-ubiquinone oxidoreductase chain 3 n=1 Tax=Trinorchestia longiramus TaxID=1923959 RepID=A0A385UMA8_9CRUS|nr:NADH dehydrogenase subunit 3 [Trinorchestia longiramus]AYB71589.1 NADH dehydrogenase subunit 3 [Trinorchestia longiramus]
MTTISALIPIFFIISAILIILVLLIGNKSNSDREKLSSFECGFDPFKKARIPFSLRFFLITIIFLVFDVEIALLLPLGVLSFFSDAVFMNISITILTVILILGLMHEWNQGALKWIQ